MKSCHLNPIVSPRHRDLSPVRHQSLSRIDSMKHNVSRKAALIVRLVDRGVMSVSDGRRYLFNLALASERFSDLNSIDDARLSLDRLHQSKARPKVSRTFTETKPAERRQASVTVIYSRIEIGQCRANAMRARG